MSRDVTISIEKLALIALSIGEVGCGLLLSETWVAVIGITAGSWVGWWLRGRAR